MPALPVVMGVTESLGFTARQAEKQNEFSKKCQRRNTTNITV